jgi:hypothetical protein
MKMRLFLYILFPSILLAHTNIINNVVLPCALTGKLRLFMEINFPLKLTVCTEGTLFFFVINGLKTVLYLNHNGTYSTKSLRCICPHVEKFVVLIDSKYLLIERFGPNVRIEWANLAQAAQLFGPKDASTTSSVTEFSTTRTSTAFSTSSTKFSLNNYINTQTTDFVQSFVMGVIGVISALLTGIMVYFRRQVSALITKINQPNITNSTHNEGKGTATTVDDDSELTARLLALRQLGSVRSGIASKLQQQQSQNASSQDNTAAPPPPPTTTSTSTLFSPHPITIVNEQANKLTCSVRQFDMTAGCGKQCKTSGGLKKHETACIEHVNKQKKIAEEAKQKRK